MSFPIDLHMHSIYSDDGEFSPSNLVHRCKDAGIKIMSISDHNCAKANLEASKVSKELNIKYIPAIEIDCTFNGINLHVLGYGIDYLSNDFKLIEQNISDQESDASKERLEATRNLGFKVTEAELNAISTGTWTGEIFAEVLLSNPKYADSEILKPYRSGGDRGDNPFVNFYWDYYSQGKPCYVEIVFPSLLQTILTIHNNGGKAILAHPANNLRNCYEILDDMILFELDGIEAFSSYHTASESKYFYNKALENNLIVTCGSDYHGKTKPSVHLGEHMCSISESEMIANLKNLYPIKSYL